MVSKKAPKPNSTPRVTKHRDAWAKLGFRYRSVLVHDDDVAAVSRYAERCLKKRRELLGSSL